MFHRVIVGFDGSPTSRRAVDVIEAATNEANLFGAAAIPVLVIPMDSHASS